MDPTTLAVLKGALEQIVDEMDVRLYRAAFSTIISEGHDACHGLYHKETGDTIIQGRFGVPVFVGVMSFAVRAVRDKTDGEVAPGDMYLVNDTYLTGTHMPDVKLVKPFFFDEELYCWMASAAHWTDIGGNVPGGYNAEATEAIQEGLVLPVVQIMEAGTINRDILDIILANNRKPDIARGDFNAQLGALEKGEERLGGLLERYGPDTVREACEELLDGSERMMREHIREIPDGTYRFEDHLDSDGIEDQPLEVAVDLKVEGDSLEFDFGRSSPPCAGPFNITYPTPVAGCYLALKHVFTDVLMNEGCFRPVKVTAPEDTFLNAPRNKPTAAYTEVTPLVMVTIWGAMARAVPNKVNGAYFTTANTLNVAGYDERGEYQVMFMYHGGGYGGTPDADGLSHGSNAISKAIMAPVEILETRFPVEYEAWELRPDSAGPGRFRGGLGARYRFRWLGEEGEAFFIGDRGKFPPFGVAGGKPGALNRIVFHHGDDQFQPPFVTKVTGVSLDPGDKVELLTPGGGGYGPPEERDPEKVAEDVRLGYLSPGNARETYLVSVDENGELDRDRTREWRERS